jgi:hypothetical protein
MAAGKLLGGHVDSNKVVEADETYVVGKATGHKDKVPAKEITPSQVERKTRSPRSS